MKRLILLFCALALTVKPVSAQWTSSRPDGHAPIGVMGDHRHEAGEVMLSYRFMYMDMEGSLIGTDDVADEAIVGPDGYMVTPTRMPMSMHMLGVMWAPSDRVTLMGMFPYLHSSMDHLTRNGGGFTTASSGFGDVTVQAMLGLAEWGRQTMHATVGLRMPTGSIERMAETPMSAPNEVILPYPMQTGSGSWALPFALTYLGQVESWSWGGQANASVFLNDNARDYKLGNLYNGTFWGARRLGEHFSVSVRGLLRRNENISGADPALNPMMVPTADPELRAGTYFDGALGVNYSLPSAKGLRFAVEGLLPLYQNLDGPQLKTNWTIVAGIQLVPVK